METHVSTKAQIILHAQPRKQDHIEPGQIFEVERLDSGEYRLSRRRPQNDGLVDWLLSCPVKDFLEPLPRDESTDDIQPGLS